MTATADHGGSAAAGSGHRAGVLRAAGRARSARSQRRHEEGGRDDGLSTWPSASSSRIDATWLAAANATNARARSSCGRGRSGGGGRSEGRMSLHCTCQLAGTVSGISTVNGARCCASTSVTCSTRSSPHVDWICSPAGGSNRNVSSGIGWSNAAASVVILWNGCFSRIAVTASRTGQVDQSLATTLAGTDCRWAHALAPIGDPARAAFCSPSPAALPA